MFWTVPPSPPRAHDQCLLLTAIPLQLGFKPFHLSTEMALSVAIPCGFQASVTLWSLCARQAAQCVSRLPLTLVLNGPCRLNVQIPQFKCKCAMLSRVHSSNKIGLCSLSSWLWSDRDEQSCNKTGHTDKSLKKKKKGQSHDRSESLESVRLRYLIWIWLNKTAPVSVNRICFIHSFYVLGTDCVRM